jgi:hypothetical protein
MAQFLSPDRYALFDLTKMKQSIHISLLIILIHVFGCTNEPKKSNDSLSKVNPVDTIQQLSVQGEEDKTEIEKENPIQILFVENFKKLKFTIEVDDELFVRAYDSSNMKISELIISHPYYGSSIFGQTSFEILQKNESTVQMMFHSQYGGDGEHTRERAKFIFF